MPHLAPPVGQQLPLDALDIHFSKEARLVGLRPRAGGRCRQGARLASQQPAEPPLQHRLLARMRTASSRHTNCFTQQGMSTNSQSECM